MKIYKKVYISIISLIFFTNIGYGSPNNYEATYVFSKNGLDFARSNHKMIYDDIKKRWCLYTESRTIGIFSLKKDIREENSCFITEYPDKYNNANQKMSIFTLDYYYRRDKSGHKDFIKSKRIENNLVTNLSKTNIKHAKEIRIDRLVAQIFGYAFDKVKVSDKGREREYRFSHIKKENIETILGSLQTIVIKKEINGSKRSTITWYSSEHSFLPVRIEQYRLNKLMFTATIREYTK